MLKIFSLVIKLEYDPLFRLKNVDDEDLKQLPCDYLTDYIKEKMSATELLDMWHRLPENLINDPAMKILLPCFIHNNELGSIQVGGDNLTPPTTLPPVSSQKNCVMCRKALQQFGKHD